MRAALLTLILMLVSVAPAQGTVVGWQDQRASTKADEAPQAIAAAKFIGAEGMRLSVLWARVQPTPTEWHWEEFDAAVDRAGGFNVQLVLGGIGGRPPAWAGGGGSHHLGAGTWRNLNDLAYVRFVSAAARRYGARVRLWSILNEVDLTGYPAERYASLFIRSRRAIRRFAGPRARVLWGEFSPWLPLGYTRKALTSAKERVVADGFAVHPYGGEHATLQGGLARLGAVQYAVGSWARRKRKGLATPEGQRLPVYGTEYGCRTRDYNEGECAQQWNEALTQATHYRLRQLVAYQLVPTDQPSWDTSLLRWDGSPSAAMRLIASWQPALRAAASP